MNSAFVNLSQYCILELRANPIGDPTPTYYSTDFYLVDNKHVNTYQIYNTNSYANITNNVRNISVVSVGGSKAVHVDSLNIPIYTQYDTNITETTIDSVYSSNIVMDTLRFHFASGFNFAEVKNLIVGANHKLNNLKQIQLASILLNANTATNLLTYNVRPLFIANTIYDRYVDIKIPSVQWLDADYVQFKENSFAWQITNGVGFIKNAPLTVFLGEAEYQELNASNNVQYSQYKLSNYQEGAIAQTNKFDALGCVIREATDGDYIEFFATWNGAFPDTLISVLNEGSSDQNWIITHQLQVYEQIGSSFYPSGNSLIYQEDKFDEILVYRPILQNAGHAVSMSIDYTMRFLNTKTGDAIIKTASVSVLNPNKYGKKLTKLHLPNGPQSMKVYNKIIKKNYELSNLFTSKSSQVNVKPKVPNIDSDINTDVTVKIREYVPIKQMDILLSSHNTLNVAEHAVDRLIYGQGQLILPIDPVDNIIRFTAYEANSAEDAAKQKPLILNNTQFKLNFGQNGKFSFDQYYEKSLSNLKHGQIVFKVPKHQAQLILNMKTDNLFYITIVSNVDGTETMFYTGTWINSANYASILKSEQDSIRAAQSDKTIAELRSRIKQLTDELDLVRVGEIDEFIYKETEQLNSLISINATAAIKPPISQQTEPNKDKYI